MSTISAGTTTPTALSLSGDTTGALTFQVNGTTTAATITSAGNVGIGTSSPTTKLTVSSATNAGISVTDGTVTTILYNTSSANGSVGTTSNHPMAFYTNNAERMRISSTGSVGIGSTTPGTYSEKLIVQSTASTQASMMWLNPGQGSGQIGIAASGPNFKLYNTYTDGLLANGKGIDIDQNGNVGIGTDIPNEALVISRTTDPKLRFVDVGNVDAKVGIVGSTALGFECNGSERARITSGGDFLVGCTANPSSSVVGVRLSKTATQGFGMSSAGGTGSLEHWYYYNPNGLVGTITTSGSATAYNTSSDRRLKENIAPADDAGALVDAIQIVKHDWKVGGHTRYGVVAQDLHDVVPEAVAEGDDGDEIEKTWGVDYSKLVPILVKEIQSLRARVAELESK